MWLAFFNPGQFPTFVCRGVTSPEFPMEIVVSPACLLVEIDSEEFTIVLLYIYKFGLFL